MGGRRINRVRGDEEMAAEGYYCRCGARVRGEHEVERNCVIIRGIPLFVHVQYQCAACGEVGEKLLAYQDPGEGPGEAAEVCSWPSAEELGGEGGLESEFLKSPPHAERGPIAAEEVTRFAGAVGRVGAADLAWLRESLAA